MGRSGSPPNKVTSFAFKDGRFANVAFDSGSSAGVPTLLVDSLGAVWVGTRDGLWTLRGDRLSRVGRGTLDAQVTAILKRRDGSCGRAPLARECSGLRVTVR